MKLNLISKTFNLLRAFTDEQKEWGVNELSRYLEMPVSSVHRSIRMLTDENILEFSELTGKYKIGAEMIRMASIIYTNVDLNKIVRPFLVDLSRELNKSVYFALYYPQYKKLSFIDSVKSANALQYVLDLGVLQPIHIAASGKNILANLSEEEILAVMKSEEIAEEKQITIVEELEIVRTQGYAKTSNERKLGALSIGSPIFDATQKVIGSIICVIPVNDFKEEEEASTIQQVVRSAKEISSLLGYKED